MSPRAVEGDADVVVGADTHQLLLELGWTPPPAPA